MLQVAADYLKRLYQDWNEQSLVYDIWHKDKAQELIEKPKARKNQHKKPIFAEKPQKDKENKPPEGFYFLED